MSVLSKSASIFFKVELRSYEMNTIMSDFFSFIDSSFLSDLVLEESILLSGQGQMIALEGMRDAFY